ncbi:MAG: InlB B-repeat-containing protein, partial [Clostridia bacterium]|nr:InlB B-repeat-containing protein [Clostridia bacterium]
YLTRYLEGRDGYDLTEQMAKNADVNADGKVDSKDYAILKKHVNGEPGYDLLPKEYTLYGDVNHDYKITDADRSYLTRYLEGRDGYDLTEQMLKNADVNADGKVDSKDYAILKKHLAGTTGYETLPYNPIPITTYNLIFKSEDNVEYQRVSYAEGASISAYATNPTKTGYNFDGWYDHGRANAYNFTTMPANDVTVYAKWTEKEYTINYNANGGTGSTMESSSCYYTNSLDLPGCDYEKTGYRFLGWDTDATATTPAYIPSQGSNGTITGATLAGLADSNNNVTVYAIWEEGTPPDPSDPPNPPQEDGYTITYNKNSSTATGETNSSTFEADSNNVPFNGCASQNTGYIFKGWSTNSTGTNIIVAYDEMGGTTSDPITGEDLAEYDTDEDKQITLYAVWEAQELTIEVWGYKRSQAIGMDNQPQFDENGNPVYRDNYTQETITINYGNTLSQNNEKLALLDERGGFNFEGWYERVNGYLSDTAFDFTTPITDDILLEAKWSYDFIYDLNGGTGTIAPQELMEGQDITISNIIPTKEGATFLGWTRIKDQYSGEFDILFEPEHTYSSNDFYNNTIYALWSYNTTTINYNLNGGTLQSGETTIPSTTVAKGSTLTITSEIPVLAEEGRIFIGWADIQDADDLDPEFLENFERIDVKSGESIDNTNGQTRSEITLYAIYGYNTMTIEYDLTGGTVPTDQETLISSHTINYNTNFDLPNITPTQTGYVFKGWSIYPSTYDGIVTGTVKIVDVAADTICAMAVWAPLWLDEANTDEVNKTTTYTIDSQEELDELCSRYIWQIEQSEETKDYKHIFNISGDLQLNQQTTFNNKSTVNILGTLNMMNNSIDLRGATISLIETNLAGLNISGLGGIRFNADANLIINGISLIGNETNSCIDFAPNERNDEYIYLNEKVNEERNERNELISTTYGWSMYIQGVATLKNTNIVNTNSFNLGEKNLIRIEPNGKLIVDYNMTVEGELTIDGELAINEGKTVTLIDDSSIQKQENSVTGLGSFIDNRNVYITYVLDNGILDISNYATTVTKQENYTLPGEPTREGFTFTGWNVKENGNSLFISSCAAGATIKFNNVERNQVEINAGWGKRPQN